jgi:capsular exopolysaccharide synthesis family protein
VDVSVANEAAMLVKLEARKMTASNLSQADVRLRSLTADAEASRVLLNDLQQRYNETKLERDMQQAEARVISEAIIPKDPSSPNVRAITAVALAASLVLGILAALLREQMDSGFRTVEQLSALTGRPAFGELPAVSGGLLGKGRRVADLVTSHNAAFAEAVNSIAVRALMSPNAQPRSFLVTSTFSDEGKSVFCIALARTLARSGMKILLVDGDLRRPSLHRMMGLDEGPGLADIAKEDLSFDTVIQRDPISPVDLMASGVCDDTPLFHLGSSRTRAVLNRCSDLYDLVIIDSPPVDLVSDARLLARTADETIYIVRWGSTPRDRVLYGLKELAETGARVSGVVLSRVSKSKSSKYSAADYAGGGRLPAQSRRVG